MWKHVILQLLVEGVEIPGDGKIWEGPKKEGPYILRNTRARVSEY